MFLELPRDRGLLAGLVLFAAGVVFVVVDVLIFAAGDGDTPLWLNLACVLAPVGFAVAIWRGLRPGRLEQRAAARRLDG